MTVTISLPRDVAANVFRALNADGGCRNAFADRLERADARRQSGPARSRSDDARATVIALGILSARLADALQTGDRR